MTQPLCSNTVGFPVLCPGGLHRSPKTEEWEITEAAHLHNKILVRMLCIMRWAKSKNPHLIVAIENPVGLLYKMPLMKMVVDELGLYRTTVHYCALGRLDKKPTHIWTNVSPSDTLIVLFCMCQNSTFDLILPRLHRTLICIRI
jgi:hypothetical protein